MAMKDRPNVVLICVDQWRGDCLSIDGHPVVHTPWLDEMALEGVRFTRAYSAVPSCIAARVALMTGLSQNKHKRVGYRDGVPWKYPVTLAGEFSRHGYETLAIGKMHACPERNQVGFDRVILHDGYVHYGRGKNRRNLAKIDDYLPWLERELGRKADYFEHGINCNSYVARPWDKPEHTHPTNWVASQAVDSLVNRKSKKPFFMFVSFHRPHPPYDPPGWALDQYLNAKMPPPPVGEWAANGAVRRFTGAKHDGSEPWFNPFRPDTSWGSLRPDILRRARAGYFGHMTHIDHQINRIVETLGETGVRDRTVICFVSDHGEMLGDHDLFRKSLPYEGSARVPLIISGPIAGLRKTSVVSEPVELRDVMPTLLECAGLPMPECLEGKTLLPHVRGEHTAWREYIHGEHTVYGQSVQWLTDGKEKYVWWSGTGVEQFFDLSTDPQELNDLGESAAAAARVGKWRKALVSELRDRPEGFVFNGELVPGRPTSALIPEAAPAA